MKTTFPHARLPTLLASFKDKYNYNSLNAGMIFLFFISGFPALFYQIIWQQRLHTIYGAHAESVAIIIGAFMLGLGIGSLVGGRIADQNKVSPFILFFIVECIIGGFGYYSLSIFNLIGGMTTQVGLWSAAIVIFFLVVLPTAAMGATLPILAAALLKRFPSVGVSVGMLYFVNTLGSGIAALLSVLFLREGIGQHGLLFIAACLNATVAVIALWFGVVARKQAYSECIKEVVGDSSKLPWLASFLAFFSGFIALSVEIIWLRIVFLYLNGRAFAFPMTLGFFLIGIAAGSLLVVRNARALEGGDGARTKFIAAACVLFAGIMLPLATLFAGYASVSGSGALLVPLTIILAFPLGLLFPLLMHIGVSPDAHAGRSISNIYAANILGSTLGSIGTGFFLLHYFSLRGVVVFLFALSTLVAIMLVPNLLRRRYPRYALIVLIVVVALGYIANKGLYERLNVNQGDYTKGMPFEHIVENRSGVIAVTTNGLVFGTGIYDGRYSTDLTHDENGILRPYALSAFHPNPKRILVIGLSSGSWAQVLANNPYAKDITIVEINPGYQKLLPLYKPVASLLTNPQVHFVVEDARRWLVRNQSEHFDAIVMNTSYYWRAGSTNLLSQDFLQILRTHLNEGGVIMYNTTSSSIVQKTGATVFPYAWRLLNAIVLSDSPIPPDKSRLEAVLRAYQIDGKAVLALTTDEGVSTLTHAVAAIDSTGQYSATSTLESREHIILRTAGVPVLTDDNMLIEWLDLE